MHCDLISLNESVISKLGVDILFQNDSAVVVLSVWRVVGPTVGKHALKVSDEEPLVAVIVGLEPVAHGLQIHGVLDVIIVISHDLSIHRDLKGPG